MAPLVRAQEKQTEEVADCYFITLAGRSETVVSGLNEALHEFSETSCKHRYLQAFLFYSNPHSKLKVAIRLKAWLSREKGSLAALVVRSNRKCKHEYQSQNSQP